MSLSSSTKEKCSTDNYTMHDELISDYAKSEGLLKQALMKLQKEIFSPAAGEG